MCLLCRCRDKQRKEASRLQAVNRKLTAMNKLLMEENERLQKQVSQLVHENAYMKQQLQNVCLRVVELTSCFGWKRRFPFFVFSPAHIISVLCLQPSLGNDTSCESNVTTPQNPLRDASNPSGLVKFPLNVLVLGNWKRLPSRDWFAIFLIN